MRFPWSKKKPDLKLDTAPNPKGVKQWKLDAFENVATGIGIAGSDKRTAGIATVVNLGREDFEALYRGDDMGATIIEALPQEMLREGYDVVIAGDPEMAEKVNKFLEDIQVNPRLMEALIWSRQHGGAAVFLAVDDGQEDLSIPLDTTKIKSLKFLNSFNSWELRPQYYYGDPMAPKYGFPSVFYFQQLFGLPQESADVGQQGVYTPTSSSEIGFSGVYPNSSMEYTNKGIQGAAVKAGKYGGNVPSMPLRLIHESRFLLFDGVATSRVQRIRNSGWGDSVFTRVFEVLRDYQMSWGGITNLLSDFAQGVYKLQGLNEMITTGDSNLAVQRISMTDTLRSIARAVALDAGSPEQAAESFERSVTSLSSLPEMVQQLSLRLAAAARMPVSLLLGQAPSGLNATGDADFQWYYDRIRAHQNAVLLPNLKRLMAVVFSAKDGPTGGKTPDNWSIQFRALWQLSDLEQSARRWNITQSDVANVGAGILLAGEVAKSRFGGDEYNPETQLDLDARKKADVGADTDAQNHASASNQKQGLAPDGSTPPPPAPVDTKSPVDTKVPGDTKAPAPTKK